MRDNRHELNFDELVRIIQSFPTSGYKGRAECFKLKDGAIFAYVPDFFPRSLAASLYGAVDECVKGTTTGWEQRSVNIFGKPRPQHRLVHWFSNTPYTYSGQSIGADPAPDLLKEMSSMFTGVVNELLDLQLKGTLDGILCNRYKDGHDEVKEHSDYETDLDNAWPIVSLSLGAARLFTLRPSNKQPIPDDALCLLKTSKSFKISQNAANRIDLTLTPGSMFIMGGTAQKTWKHAVPTQSQVKEARINLTFRKIRNRPR